MILQLLKFLLNGAAIGIVAALMQSIFFRLFDTQSTSASFFASALTYIPLIVLNFYIQKSVVFEVPGFLSRFFICNLGIMLFVSTISPLCWALINVFLYSSINQEIGFVLAALIGAFPSFLLSKFFVFRTNEEVSSDADCDHNSRLQ